ncbi:MAG: radical SAM protein [Desulfurococcales archaeon]|nr:radical SAM protein [Desulfurococcales archaeon]
MVYWPSIRPDAILVWRNPEVRRRLRWYRLVLEGRVPPRYMLARNYLVDGVGKNELGTLSLDELWRIHVQVTSGFRELLFELTENPRDRLVNGGTGSVSLLELKAEITRRLSNPCVLCERKCMIDRRKRIGACRLDEKAYVHSAFLHMGEEAPLVPSGTIFYGGCNFTCVYCQNYDISQEYPRHGKPVTPRELASIQDLLAGKGARNINHVGGEPAPSAHIIVESMLYAHHRKPQLWNSNMYMTEELLEVLLDIIDIWLPDFKYGNNKCAFRLSGVQRYMDVVPRNIRKAAEIGDMIIRHLVLPGHLDCCTRRILEYIADKLPADRILVNIMGQYRPEHLVSRYPSRWRDIARRPRPEEIEEARRIASSLGLCWRPVS